MVLPGGRHELVLVLGNPLRRATEGDFGPSKKQQSAPEHPSLADATPSLLRPSGKRHRQVNAEPSIGPDLNTTYLWSTALEPYRRATLVRLSCTVNA